jgi:hypothetical protein
MRGRAVRSRPVGRKKFLPTGLSFDIDVEDVF